MRFRVGREITCFSLCFGTLCFGQSGSASAADDTFSVTDRLQSAVEAVEQGIDDLWPPEERPEDLTLRLGAGLGFVPDYTGSDNYRLHALPLIEVRYKDVWRLDGTRFSYAAYRSGGFEAGPLIRYRFGRNESANAALEGLGDIDNTVEVGGFARYHTKSLLISAEMSQALSSALGRTVRLTVGHGVYRDEKWLIGVAARAKAISRKAAQTEFGLTRAQSDRSGFGLPAFSASAGFSEVSLTGIAAYRVTKHARVVSIVSLGRLVSSAAESPLVANGVGSRTQAVVGSALTFEF
ncbi:MipA/OmpV family protein [Pseudokordiimonas caeni]|uniref:MipA/OmpV family protein n=1 Tax=Pseudokordiimonas caeni TaxID=2997908 RepID=UPI00281219C1|nr:MipA/OmpV family protein [Pseudokordiimonas caeni]